MLNSLNKHLIGYNCPRSLQALSQYGIILPLRHHRRTW